MKERIAIISGYRTPFCKADTCLKKMSAEDLGAFITKELLYRINLSPTEIDEVIVGNVAQPAQAMNIARVISLKAGLPIDIPSFTVHRNCASGMESMTSAANKIIAGEADTVLAVATESMTHIPLLFNSSMTHFFKQMLKKRSLPEKLAHLLSFRPKFLSPVIGLKLGLTDPVCGLLMGVTAENLADEFSITRKEQDIYALNSHLKAAAAMEQGFLDGEIIPTPIPNNYRDFQKEDNGVRKNQNIEI